MSANFLFVDDDSVLRGLRKHAALLYETEKHEVLNQLPDQYLSSLGEVGFCQGRPVQILSPYQVPLGALRRDWIQAFLKVGQDNVFTTFAFLFTHNSLCLHSLNRNENLRTYRICCIGLTLPASNLKHASH